MAVLIATTAPAAAAQVAPGDMLSLDAAIDLALLNNPALLQQKTDVDVAGSAVRSAYGSWLPNASANVGFGYTAPGELRYQSRELGQQPEYYSSDYGLRLSYQLSGSTLIQPSVERSRLRATERRVYGAEAQLVADVTRQYLLALQARERVVQAQREVARTAEHVKLAAGRLEVGAGTPLDLRRAEVQQGQSEVRLVQAENTVSTEMLRLAQLLGIDLPIEIPLEDGFALFQPEWSPEELIERAYANNPALLAARANADAASMSSRAARSEYLPSLSFSVGLVGSVYQAGNIDPLVDQRIDQLENGFAGCLSQNEVRSRVGLALNDCIDPANANVREAVRQEIAGQNSGFPFGYTRQPLQASVGVSIPIFNGLAREHQVEVARAGAEDARHQVRAEELRLKQEITAAVLGLQAAYRTALLQENVHAAAEDELRLATERFRFGAATSIEVTDAQTSLAQAEIDRIESVFNFHQSLAALEALVGETLR